MPVVTTDMEMSAARIRILPQRYKHFRQSVWQNYTDIGSRALACGDAHLAHTMFGAALTEARKEEHIDYRLAVSFSHVAHSLLSMGELGQAANKYLKALSIARSTIGAPKVFEIMLLETLGDIRLRQGHLRLAKRHLTRALALREKSEMEEQADFNDWESRAKLMLKLAHISSEMKQTDEAIALYERSKTLTSLCNSAARMS
jgi:tetratricopeptide (TPR) repeat protein